MLLGCNRPEICASRYFWAGTLHHCIDLGVHLGVSLLVDFGLLELSITVEILYVTNVCYFFQARASPHPHLN
jgi:hypothetical protein